jgi:L-rhamnose mutarotase
MKRMAMVLGIKPDKVEQYKALHRDVWPDVLLMLKRCNIGNYSIFLREPENLLFSYWEYHGKDFVADSGRMAGDPTTQRWWALCGPCQNPLPTRVSGHWWASMEEVFYLE